MNASTEGLVRAPGNVSRGQTLVIVSLALLIMVGFVALVVEIGRLAAAKHDAIQAVEAAALAAGMRLPNQTTGLSEAQRVGGLNNAGTVSVVYPTPRSVEVTCTRSVSFLLAGLWGRDRTSVRGKATVAQTDPATAVSDTLRPLAVLPGAYTLSRESTLSLRVLPGTWRSTEFVALSLGGSGGANFVANLQGGYSGTVRVAEEILTEASAMQTSVKRGIIYDSATRNALFQQAVRPPYRDNGRRFAHPNYPYGDPRIMVVAIAEQAAGRAVVVRGFAAFYVVSVASRGRVLKGRFLEYSTASVAASAASQTDYGLRGYQFAP